MGDSCLHEKYVSNIRCSNGKGGFKALMQRKEPDPDCEIKAQSKRFSIGTGTVIRVNGDTVSILYEF